MPSIKLTPAQRHARTRARLTKLGLLDKSAGKATFQRAVEKYYDVLRGKASAVKVPKSKAKELRGAFRTRGDVVVIPRVKGERVKVSKKGNITTSRYAYGTIIHKRITPHLEEKPVKARAGRKVYYTIPLARGKQRVERKTFSTLDDMLRYMKQYELNWSDWEKYIEIEEVEPRSDRDKTLKRRVGSQIKRARWKRQQEHNEE